MSQLIGNNGLKIQLINYSKPSELTEQFYFLEMSTLQVTTLISHDKKIVSIKNVVYDENDKYSLEVSNMKSNTIGDFNDFFLKNPKYYIHDCDIYLEDGIHIRSHDDGEVSIEYKSDSLDQIIIERIFETFKLDKNLIEILKNKPGHYTGIDNNNCIIGEFKNFKDYLKNGR